MWIIDMGSGNSCKNDPAIVKAMIDSLAGVPRHKIVLKWQLFKTSKINTPLDREVFRYAYEYARGLGFVTTSSVADWESLDFLNQFDVPFVKIPCRPDLYPLVMDSSLKFIVSVKDHETLSRARLVYRVTPLACVREYPADSGKYLQEFGVNGMIGLSDHTVGWRLYDLTKPLIYECHLKLHDTTGPDAGPWARYPDEIVQRIAMEDA